MTIGSHSSDSATDGDVAVLLELVGRWRRRFAEAIAGNEEHIRLLTLDRDEALSRVAGLREQLQSAALREADLQDRLAEALARPDHPTATVTG